MVDVMSPALVESDGMVRVDATLLALGHNLAQLAYRDNVAMDE